MTDVRLPTIAQDVVGRLIVRAQIIPADDVPFDTWGAENIISVEMAPIHGVVTDHIFLLDHCDCCERRYFHTDDDLEYLTNSKIVSLEMASSGPSFSNRVDEDHEESTFLRLVTTKGAATFVAYNVHNGYYSGFNFKMLALQEMSVNFPPP